MNNTYSPIAIIADDISAEDFLQFINEKYNNESLSASIQSQKKEGRSALGEFLVLAMTSSLVSDLSKNVLYDVLKFGFSRLYQIFGSKPMAIIKLKNGVETRISGSLTNEEIRSKIIDVLLEGDITSIHFDS